MSIAPAESRELRVECKDLSSDGRRSTFGHREGSGAGASPAEQFHGSIWRTMVLPRRAVRSCRRTSIPHLHCVPVGGAPWPPANQGSAGSRPTSPRPSGGCAPQMFRRPPRFLLSTPPGSTCRSRATWRHREANGWRRTGARPPAAEGTHRGMGGARTAGLSRRQDPLATSAERGACTGCSFLLRPLFRGRGGMLW
jgi:hypothetical protein